MRRALPLTIELGLRALRAAEDELAVRVEVRAPSGSGKTTLLNLCAGFRTPSSGGLSVLGTSFESATARTRAATRRSAVGIVRQHYHRALPREFTVEEIVTLPLQLLGRVDRDDRTRVAELLRRSGLETKRGAYPHELSGGQQQRVAVCAALAKRPRLLLADEPTGELDAAASATVVELMLELADEADAASLIVTHDPEVALHTSRTIHIRDGRLAAEGAERPVLIVDQQGWLRLPRRLREQAGVQERVHAAASWGRIELVAEAPQASRTSRSTFERLAPDEKRAGTEVALDRINKRYGANAVLRDFSALFAPEQLHVVAGPSGTGKTTLLNLIAALERPDTGEVWVASERVDSLAPDEAARFRRRSIGYLSQHSTLVDFLSALENVTLALTLRGFSENEARRRAERWLEWVGIGQLASRRADRLSGREQRRVALARALAPGPRVLIADEPTAHLDQLNGRLVIRLLADAAHEAGTTVVTGSHDRDLVAAADSHLTLAQAT